MRWVVLKSTFTFDIDPTRVQSPVQAAFMLAADGHECVLPSTLEREMAFAVHHGIHHNALVKLLIAHNFPDLLPKLAADFGMAPSTSNYLLNHPAAQA